MPGWGRHPGASNSRAVKLRPDHPTRPIAAVPPAGHRAGRSPIQARPGESAGFAAAASRRSGQLTGKFQRQKQARRLEVQASGEARFPPSGSSRFRTVGPTSGLERAPQLIAAPSPAWPWWRCSWVVVFGWPGCGAVIALRPLTPCSTLAIYALIPGPRSPLRGSPVSS